MNKRMFIVDKDYEGFIAETFENLSEQKKICNVMILAYAEDGEVTTATLNASNLNEVAVMLFRANTHMQARAILTHKDYYEEMFADYEFEDVDDGGEEISEDAE